MQQTESTGICNCGFTAIVHSIRNFCMCPYALATYNQANVKVITLD